MKTTVTILALIVMAIIIIYSLSKPNKNKILMLLLAIPIFGVLIAQSYSLRFVGDYIPSLAFSNLHSINEIDIKAKYFIPTLASMIIAYVFNIYMTKKKNTPIYITLIMGLMLSIHPVFYFSKAFYNHLHESRKEYLSLNEIRTINKEIRKNWVVKDNQIAHYLDTGDKPNILVIFTEGISSSVISPELTPNIYKFRTQSLDVKNFYNHTAATFRGLRGQLTSSYQMTGGYTNDKSGIGQQTQQAIEERYKNSTVTSITHALKEAGYHTYFQASNSKNSPLSLMLASLSFDEIYGADDYKKDPNFSIEELSDQDSYNLLFKKINEISKPFFYGVYTVGTHVGLDSPDIKYGDGKNEYLNKFHAMDHWFGQFMEKFNQSELSTNTIIIFTADHATYGDDIFKQMFDQHQSWFTAEVPFIIYKKGMKPRVINVNGLNSLSTAPTILNIAGINKYDNFFLGKSVFDNWEGLKYNRITTIGEHYYTTSNLEVKDIEDPALIAELKMLQTWGDY